MKIQQTRNLLFQNINILKFHYSGKANYRKAKKIPTVLRAKLNQLVIYNYKQYLDIVQNQVDRSLQIIFSFQLGTNLLDETYNPDQKLQQKDIKNQDTTFLEMCSNVNRILNSQVGTSISQDNSSISSRRSEISQILLNISQLNSSQTNEQNSAQINGSCVSSLQPYIYLRNQVSGKRFFYNNKDNNYKLVSNQKQDNYYDYNSGLSQYQNQKKVMLVQISIGFDQNYVQQLNVTAKASKDIGKYEQSVGYYNQILQYFLQQKDYPNFILYRQNINSVQIIAGQFKNGYKLIQQNKLKLKEYALDSNASLVSKNLLNYYVALRNLGKNVESIALFKQYVQKKQLNNGNEEQIQEAWKNLCYAYCDAKIFNQAFQILNDLKKDKKYIQSDLKFKGQIYSIYARIWKKKKKYPQALKCYEIFLNLAKLAYGQYSQYISIPYKHIGEIYFQLGQYQKSLTYLTKSLEIIQSSLGKTNAKYATTMKSIGGAYLKMKKYLKAVEMLLKSESMFKQYFDQNNFSRGQVLFYLGRAYKQLNKYKKAQRCFLQCLKIRKINYGESDSQYKQTLQQLNQVNQILSLNTQSQ